MLRMLTSLPFLQLVKIKKSKKLLKIVKMEEVMGDFMNLNEIFRKNVTYDDIKNDQKTKP